MQTQLIFRKMQESSYPSNSPHGISWKIRLLSIGLAIFITILAIIVLNLFVIILLPIINNTILNDNFKHTSLMLFGVTAIYVYDKFMITKFNYNPLQIKISELEEKLDELENTIAELENENEYLVSMDTMRQEEWEKMMRTQSKVYTQLQSSIDKKFNCYKKMLKKMENEL
jgi:hypothetical protein